MFLYKKTMISSLFCVISLLFVNKTEYVYACIRFSQLVKRFSVNDACLLQDITCKYQEFFNLARYDRTLLFKQAMHMPIQTDRDKFIPLTRFDSLKLYRSDGGGNCVGLSLGLKDQMKQIGVELQVIASPLPGYLECSRFPYFGHAAALLSCKDGVILFDPSMMLPEPVVISNHAPGSIQSGYRSQWTYKLDWSKGRLKVFCDSCDPINRPWSENKKNSYRTYFQLASVDNPDEAISVPSFYSNRQFIIRKLQSSGKAPVILTLDLERNILEFSQINALGLRIVIFNLRLAEYKKDPMKFKERLLRYDQIADLGLDKKELITRIAQILDQLEGAAKIESF